MKSESVEPKDETPVSRIPHDLLHEVTNWAVKEDIEPQSIKELETILNKYF